MKRETVVELITASMAERASIEELIAVYRDYQKHDLLDYSTDQLLEVTKEYCIEINEPIVE